MEWEQHTIFYRENLKHKYISNKMVIISEILILISNLIKNWQNSEQGVGAESMFIG